MEAFIALVHQDTVAVFFVQVSHCFLILLYIIFETDIGECLLGISDCNQTCINTVGSYYCQCKLGYTLSNDSHSCLG